jgi:hypothetical protein
MSMPSISHFCITLLVIFAILGSRSLIAYPLMLTKELLSTLMMDSGPPMRLRQWITVCFIVMITQTIGSWLQSRCLQSPGWVLSYTLRQHLAFTLPKSGDRCLGYSWWSSLLSQWMTCSLSWNNPQTCSGSCHSRYSFHSVNSMSCH